MTPADREQAKQVVACMYDRPCDKGHRHDSVEDLIAEALAAQRERAAETADKEAARYRVRWNRHGLAVNALDSRGDEALAALRCAEDIAAAIREGSR